MNAVEKAAPGAKRILCGIVSDTLTLAKKESPAKPVFTVLRSKGSPEEMFEMIITEELEQRYDLRFICFETEAEMLKLVQQRSFDLIALYLWNVFWNGTTLDLLVDRAVEVLGRLKAQHGKPIIASQGLDLTERFERVGVTFLPAPFDIQTFRNALENCLALAKKEPPHRNRQLRIVVVDDDDDWLKFVEAMILDWFKDAETVTYNSSQAALRELEQRDPDLLITGDKMPRMTGEELVRRLIAKNVNYPILVLTGHDEAQQWVREYASRGFNVRFQPKRGVEHELKRSIEEILNTQRGTIEKSVENAPQPRNERALKIVVLDEEEGPRRSCVVMLKSIWYHGVEILEFGDAHDAWLELSRTDPDLFITDIQHVGISCKEMLTWLAERKVKYPILVISAVLGVYEDLGKPVWVQGVRRDWSPNLNVSFLSKPYTLEEFRTAVETALQIPAQRAP